MIGKRFLKGKRSKMVRHYFKVLVALLLAITAVLNITYAWLENTRENRLYSNSFITVSADGLIMETVDGEIKDSISITNVCSELTECSSKDGRNIYFPLSDHNTFRKATANDRNSKYIALEFTLTSDKNTDVWISNESYILGAATDAIRISLDYGAETGPTVFNGSEEYYENFEQSGSEETTEQGRVATKAVYSINSEGVATYADQDDCALSTYFFTAEDDSNQNVVGIKDNKLLTLEAGVSKHIVMTVWLEGCDTDCTNEVYNKKDLQIQLRFTAGVKDPRVLKFSDCTYETWAHLKSLDSEHKYLDSVQKRVFLRDTDTGVMYAMVREKKTEQVTIPTTASYDIYHWKVTLPKTVENIEFIRLDYHNGNPDPDEDWEFWKAGAIKEPNGTPVLRFFALDGGSCGENVTNNGIWTNSTSIMTIYFTDTITEVCDTNISYSVNFAYHGSMIFKMKMSNISFSETGPNVYAARIVAAATQGFAFEQSAYSLNYQAPGRSNRAFNMFNTSTRVWSYNSAYPIN